MLSCATLLVCNSLIRSTASLRLQRIAKCRAVLCEGAWDESGARELSGGCLVFVVALYTEAWAQRGDFEKACSTLPRAGEVVNTVDTACIAQRMELLRNRGSVDALSVCGLLGAQHQQLQISPYPLRRSVPLITGDVPVFDALCWLGRRSSSSHCTRLFCEPTDAPCTPSY